MSFTTFGPLPTSPQNPISGLPALEAAIRRLEATIPAPASRDAGGTSSGIACTAVGPGGAPFARTEASGTSDPAWQMSDALLVEIDPDVRLYLRRVFERALEAVEDDQALPPERRRLVPVPFVVQHWGRPRFETGQPREQDQKGLDRLLRQAIWRAVDALEAAALRPHSEVYQSILTEQCTQFARVYQELKRRAGDAAVWVVWGELRLLHHRGSITVEQMLFA